MTDNLLIPASQYLRMSTEHQHYSMPNRIAVISQSAAPPNFTIIQTDNVPKKSRRIQASVEIRRVY